MNKIKIIQVLRDKDNKNCSVFFMIGEDFYLEKFDYQKIDSEDTNVPLITPLTHRFNLFVANNKKFKQTLFEIMQKLDQDERIVFPVTVEIEWKDFALNKKQPQEI